ncbi:MAG: DUF58 domain-containing protein [Candidatus Omnitrophica bacterium]|nr:DUF58 domain-containing protein [Candidatus Omnitrophota bacterium]
MIPKELFKKIRRIEIVTSRLVTDVFAGQYHSVFKGQGIEFDEVREYQIGDDIRTIDWNVTARTGKPHVKKFVEERELTVMIMVDMSHSLRFGSVNNLKNQIAAEISAVLALSAIQNNDKVGLIIFTDKVEKFIPPRKGRSHVLRVIREVLYFEPQGKTTNIEGALEYLSHTLTRRSIVFLISDFLAEGDKKISSLRNSSLKKTIAIANKRHDLVAVTLNDPRESELPECGLVYLEDAETGEIFTIDCGDKMVRENYKSLNVKRIKDRERMLRSAGVDMINISTDKSYVDEIIKFFKQRGRRKRR